MSKVSWVQAIESVTNFEKICGCHRPVQRVWRLS